MNTHTHVINLHLSAPNPSPQARRGEDLEPNTPYFITETEIGERHETTAAELAEVFRFRFPKLVFLSGCRTGQAPDKGAVPSMAETLIAQGARAVLSWGLQSVFGNN